LLIILLTMALSYATDIKPLFNKVDQEHMVNQGIDLWSYDDVKSNADNIHTAVSTGHMPPKRDGGPWPKDKVAKFKQWMVDGMMP
jgi:hypothetical protein